MTARVEIVRSGVAPGDLDLADFDDPDGLADAVTQRLAEAGEVTVRLAVARDRRGDAAMTLPAAFEAILRAAGTCASGAVRCVVASDVARDRLRAMLPGGASSIRRYRRGRWLVVVRCGDVTRVVADAVVNASNTRLRLGGGVSDALRRACGPGLQAEMDRLGEIPADGLAVTDAHALTTARYVVHVPTAGGEPEVVRRAMENVLACCERLDLASVAVPALGSGTGALPTESVARLCAEALHGVEAGRERAVLFVLWAWSAYADFERVFDGEPGFERLSDEG